MPARPIAFEKNPNPQGKGLVPVLRDWGAMQPTAVSGTKSSADFLRDYCLSSLVLSAHFRFKPVVGKPYFLYASELGCSLSLIAPQEWGQHKAGDFVATCRLRPDMTWELDTSEVDEHSPALVRAQTFIWAFVGAFARQDCISAHLPFYCARLPYYQRLLGTALASSLQRCLPVTGDDAQALLATLPTQLLLNPARTPTFLRPGLNQQSL